MDDHNEQPSGQEVEEEDHDTTTDDDDDDDDEGSDEESGIEDDQTSYLRELRDELVEQRQQTLERQQALEAKRAERRGKMETMARKIMFCYGQALRLDPGPAARVIIADGGAGVQEFGGGVGDGHDQIQDDQMQDELEGFIQGIDLTQLARAMARARRSPFYATELERYRQRYQGLGLSELVLHVFTFVSTMEFHGLAPPRLPPKPPNA